MRRTVYNVAERAGLCSLAHHKAEIIVGELAGPPPRGSIFVPCLQLVSRRDSGVPFERLRATQRPLWLASSLSDCVVCARSNSVFQEYVTSLGCGCSVRGCSSTVLLPRVGWTFAACSLSRGISQWSKR